MLRSSQTGVVTNTEGFTVKVAFTLNRNKSITVLVIKMGKGILREDRIVCSSWQESRGSCLHCIGHQEMEDRA